jgi:hypothetical protein
VLQTFCIVDGKIRLAVFDCYNEVIDKRLGFCNEALPTITELFDNAENLFFARMLSNNEHLLCQFLTERLQAGNNSRERPQNKFLLTEATFHDDDDFLIRMLYKHCYYYLS